MTLFFVLLAVLAGVVLTIQLGVNNALGRTFNVPVWTTLTSFLVGSVVLLVLGIVTRAPAPERFNAPAWMWTGGALGAVYVFSTIFLAPRLGAATLTGAVVAGQLIAALMIDHFGWLKIEQHSITPGRVVGALLLLAGVVLIRRF